MEKIVKKYQVKTPLFTDVKQKTPHPIDSIVGLEDELAAGLVRCGAIIEITAPKTPSKKEE